MRWLVTGGCGFIGTNLIYKLRLSGVNNIRVVDNLSVGTREDLSRVTDFEEITESDIGTDEYGVELIIGDVLDADLALRVCADVDVIVHLAANTGVGPSVEDPMFDCKVNVIGTVNYLEGARINKASRFVFASSGAPAGEVEPPIHEEIVPKPVSPYGSSKLAGEGYCSSYFRCFGIETVALRFGNVYGPGSKHKGSVVAKFINQALAGKSFEIYGDGNQTRDFIFVEDLVCAIVCGATESSIGGEVFQIATSKETTVGELALLMKEILESKGLNVPEIIYAESRNGDVKRNFSDTTKAYRRLGWTSETELRDGLSSTLSFFLD